MLQQQEMNQESLKIKAVNEELRQSNEALATKAQQDSYLYDNRHTQRELQDLKKIDRYQKENDTLKERIMLDSHRSRKEREILREIVERAKATSVAEMKQIAQQKKEFSDQYDNLVLFIACFHQISHLLLQLLINLLVMLGEAIPLCVMLFPNLMKLSLFVLEFSLRIQFRDLIICDDFLLNFDVILSLNHILACKCYLFGLVVLDSPSIGGRAHNHP